MDTRSAHERPFVRIMLTDMLMPVTGQCLMMMMFAISKDFVLKRRAWPVAVREIPQNAMAAPAGFGLLMLELGRVGVQ